MTSSPFARNAKVDVQWLLFALVHNIDNIHIFGTDPLIPDRANEPKIDCNAIIWFLGETPDWEDSSQNRFFDSLVGCSVKVINRLFSVVITDIPTSSDFQNAGINMLNLAWNSTVSLLIERIFDGVEINANLPASNNYLKSTQPILASSLSLIQQGVEFFLKGRIAEVSPYLLISGTPSNFPKNSHRQNTSFSDFRTIDAQDLIRVHDTVSVNHLSDEFCQWYDDLRRLRNKLMHTVDKTIAITDKDILIKIMEGCEYCVKPLAWVAIRNQYLMNSPSGHLLQDFPLEQINDKEKTAYHLGQLQSEIMTVIEYLEPHYSKHFFGFQKKQHRYICLNCLSVREHGAFFAYKDIEEVWLNTAQIDKFHPEIVHCIFCDGNYLIKREKCPYCGNDIIDAYNNLCLSCTHSISKDVEIQPSRKVVA